MATPQTMKPILTTLILLACMLGAAEPTTTAEKDAEPLEVAETWQASALRPGDVLQINVFRTSEFNKRVRIEEDGKFTFPLCGIIDAAGLSPREVAAELTRRLSNQVANPHVDIFVESWGPRAIYLLGEFKSGSMSISLPAYGRMTALQAISAAGGFNDSADLTKVTVLRRDRTGTRLKRIPVDVSALVGLASSASDNFVMLPEDTLLVPRAPAVAISGAVRTPVTRNINTKRPPMLSEMLVLAGGLTDSADPGNITIVRQDDQGKRAILHASLLSTAPGIYEKDLQVAPGDQIFIANAPPATISGAVKTPSSIHLDVNLLPRLSEAIAQHGGLSDAANPADILIVRRSPDGKRTTLKASLRSPEPGVFENDPVLRPGDQIFVGAAHLVTVTGAVKNPSILSIDPVQPPRLSELIMRIGGMTPNAACNQIHVARGQANGKRLTFTASLKNIAPGVYEHDPVIQPGDHIFVATALPVTITGAVKNPTSLIIDANRLPRLSELLLRIGGLAMGADQGNITVVRTNPDGTRVSLIGSLDSTRPGDYENDLVIQPGDQIFATEAKKIYVVGQVSRPQGLTLPPGARITVSQAIALCGGFTATASKSGVVIIRGTERIKADIRRLYDKAGNLDKDLPLRYGDIVFIPESFW